MNRKLIALTAAVAALALPAASLAHSATSGSSSTTAAASANRPHHHPPFAAIAKELGVDVATVKAAFKANRPAEGQRPTAAQREAVAAALGTTAAKLDAIMKEHAPQRGPKAPIAQIAKELGLSEPSRRPSRPTARLRAPSPRMPTRTAWPRRSASRVLNSTR
jgi:hypothetical protein